MTSGEISAAEFVAFLENTVSRTIAASINGSIHYWFTIFQMSTGVMEDDRQRRVRYRSP